MNIHKRFEEQILRLKELNQKHPLIPPLEAIHQLAIDDLNKPLYHTFFRSGQNWSPNLLSDLTFVLEKNNDLSQQNVREELINICKRYDMLPVIDHPWTVALTTLLFVLIGIALGGFMGVIAGFVGALISMGAMGPLLVPDFVFGTVQVVIASIIGIACGIPGAALGALGGYKLAETLFGIDYSDFTSRYFFNNEFSIVQESAINLKNAIVC